LFYLVKCIVLEHKTSCFVIKDVLDSLAKTIVLPLISTRMAALPLAAWMRQDELVRSRMNVVRLIGQIDTRKPDGLSTKPVDLPPDPNNLILKQLY